MNKTEKQIIKGILLGAYLILSMQILSEGFE